MLRYIETEGKTFEERLSDAITDIPLYTDEWTNFNPSDPAVTILETLIGFETLQQDSMGDIPPRVRQNLLKLVGFNIKKGRNARLLLSAANVKEPVVIPANHKFRLGELCFETNREILLDDRRLIGVYGKKGNDENDGEYKDFAFLTDRETKVPALIFGENPEEGDALYMIANRLPEEGKELTFFVSLQRTSGRNPMDVRTEKLFADVAWECFTEDGWVEMNVRDNSKAFLMSGEVRMWMPDSPAAVFTEAPKDGYAIRARLKSAEYDVRPKLVAIEAFLFEVWQQDTICECLSISKIGEADIISEMAEEAYIDVFCREEKGESYRKYEFDGTGSQAGRYYSLEHTQYGRHRIIFDRRKRGFGPARGRDCIKAVIYTEDVMRRYYLGRVLGYDNQEIELPYRHIVQRSFCIIARRTDEYGEYIYDFVRPERSGEDELYYHLLENDGRILIDEAGAFIGAELYLASAALTNGPDGNIREGNFLISEGDGEVQKSGITFFNPGPGTGGEYRERLESVRQRFLRDMETSYTAVSEDDYERIVLSTPGLCIHKAKAQMDEERNLVKIAVKENTDREFPRLSDIYQRIIKERIDERRLLTTRVELIQPAYVPVNVRATVYVKLHFENAAARIEEVIREKTDYINSDKNFGDVLKFDDVFHAIELLDCVEYVYELSMRPKTPAFASMRDNDIVPRDNCLLYPGDIRVEAVTFES